MRDIDNKVKRVERFSDKENYDNVNNPSHYTMGRRYEPIDVIEDWDLGYHISSTLKYLSRYNRKNDDQGIEDLNKARYYLDRKINMLKLVK